jgi:hypothetical protein
MPLARIITSTPDEALAIAERLRAQGYVVETVAPGDASDHHADLELKLEHATAAEVLAGVTQRTVASDADVYIGARVFQSAAVTVATARRISAGAPTVADTMNGVAAGLQNKRDLLAKALREQRMLLREARQAERLKKRLADTAQSQERRAEETLGVRPTSEQPTLNGLPVAAESSDEDASVLNSELRAPTEVAPASPCEAVLSTAPVESISLPAHPEPATESRVSQVPAVTSEPHFAEHKIEESATIAAVRPAAGSIGDIGARVPVSRPRKRAIRIKFKTGKPLSRRGREWRAAVLISSLFATLLMLGWGVVTRQPVSPLPRSFSANPNVQQAVPFGAATLGPPNGATAPTSRSLPTPNAATAQEVRSAARPGNKPDASGRVSTSNRNQTPQKVVPRERARRSSDDYVAEDQVIYHRSAPKPPPVQKEKASLKRFSD